MMCHVACVMYFPFPLNHQQDDDEDADLMDEDAAALNDDHADDDADDHDDDDAKPSKSSGDEDDTFAAAAVLASGDGDIEMFDDEDLVSFCMSAVFFLCLLVQRMCIIRIPMFCTSHHTWH